MDNSLRQIFQKDEHLMFGPFLFIIHCHVIVTYL